MASLGLCKYNGAKILLIWTKQSSVHFLALSRNVLCEICEYLGAVGTLAYPSPNFLRFFRHESQLWTTLRPHSSIQIDPGSSRWVLLDNSRVFCCGGVLSLKATTLYWKSTYLLESTGQVSNLAPMIWSRAFHGLIEWRKLVCAFGGRNNEVTSGKSSSELLTNSEAYQLEGVAGWQAMQSAQHGRCSFNPCLFRETIYLSGYGSTVIEGYSPWLNVMTVLSCQLPEPTACCLYVLCNVLFIHSDNYILKYKGNRKSWAVEISKTKTKRAVAKWQSSQPVLDPASGLVYCARAEECWTFHMLTGLPGPLYS